MKLEATQETGQPKVEVNLDKSLVQNDSKPEREKISIQLRDSYTVNLDGNNVAVKVPRRKRSISGAGLKRKLGVYKGDNLFVKSGSRWKKVSNSEKFDLRKDLNFNTASPKKESEVKQPTFSSMHKALAD